MTANPSNEVKLFEFVGSGGWSGTSPVVCIGAASMIAPIMDETAIQTIFGGIVKYREEVTGLIFVGVWGRRNASKWRRLLRERGAIVTLAHVPPASLRLMSLSR